MSDLALRACATAGVTGVIVALAGLITGPIVAAVGIGLIITAYCVAVRTSNH